MTTATAQQSSGFASIMDTNQKTMNQIDSFRKAPITATPRNLIFIGMLVGTSILFMAFASQIIAGMTALILTGVTGIGGYYVSKFIKHNDTYFRQKMKNDALKRMVSEAQDNAIYQLDNQVITNQERLDHARDARNKMGAMVEQLRNSINPENVGKAMHTRKTDMLERVQKAYEIMSENLVNGAKANTTFRVKVDEYRDMNKFANLAAAAMDLMGASGAQELENMLSLESFSAIDSNFSGAIISIENSARDMQLDQGVM